MNNFEAGDNSSNPAILDIVDQHHSWSVRKLSTQSDTELTPSETWNFLADMTWEDNYPYQDFVPTWDRLHTELQAAPLFKPPESRDRYYVSDIRSTWAFEMLRKSHGTHSLITTIVELDLPVVSIDAQHAILYLNSLLRDYPNEAKEMLGVMPKVSLFTRKKTMDAQLLSNRLRDHIVSFDDSWRWNVAPTIAAKVEAQELGTPSWPKRIMETGEIPLTGIYQHLDGYTADTDRHRKENGIGLPDYFKGISEIENLAHGEALPTQTVLDYLKLKIPDTSHLRSKFTKLDQINDIIALSQPVTESTRIKVE